MRRKFRIRGSWGSLVRRLAGSTAVLLLASVICAAQYPIPVASAAIDSAAKGGFYRVVLVPRLVAECRSDLSDLRIYDQFGQETPYVLKSDVRDDSLNAGMLAIPDPQITRKDSSNRHTYYRLQYNAAYRIDRLSFVIRQPVLFKRQAVISRLDDSAAQEEVQTISIDPKDTAFRVPPVKSNCLLIDITNEDNAPLDIGRVATAQSGIYLVTLLRSDRRYALTAGDQAVRAPDYDLHFFTDSMKAVPALIGLGPVKREDLAALLSADKPKVEKKNGRSGLLLWSLVTVIVLLLLYVSIKLARAVDQKGQ